MGIRACLVIAGLLVAGCGPDHVALCQRAITSADWNSAKTSCQAAYEREHDPDFGLALARSYFQLGDDSAALSLAESFFATRASATARQIAGNIYEARGETRRSQRLFTEALRLHRAAGDHGEAARDAHALAGSFRGAQRFREAIEALDDCLLESDAANDAQMRGYAHLAMGEILASIGDREAAEWAYQRAAGDLSSSPVNRAWLSLKVGIFYRETRQLKSSEAALREALRGAEEAALPEVEVAAKLNLIDVLLQQARPDEAGEMLADARRLLSAPSPEQEAVLTFSAGLLARAKGDLSTSAEHLARAAETPPDPDWDIKIAVERGKTATARDELKRAEESFLYAISIVEQLRADAGAPELRSWVLAERRAPYEELFALFARQGRGEDALAVFESMHARAFLDLSSLRESSTQGEPPRAAAVRAESLREFLSTLQRAPSAKPPPVASLLRTLAGREVLAYEEAGGHSWAIHLCEGRVSVFDLGPLGEVRAAAAAFVENPEDAAAAEHAAALLLPAALHSADAPLLLVTSESLARVPFAALRRGGHFLIEERPLAFVPSLSAAAPPLLDPTGAPVVLGDPTANLPGARAEAEQLASLLGVTPLLDKAATREAVFQADGAPVLHIAAHARIGGAGGSLLLADGELGAAEIVSRGLRASVVVLASCASAASRGRDQWGALSLAFMAAGSRSVIATMRPVNDEDARRLISSFYSFGWQQPAESLANAQRSLAGKKPVASWAYFAVYGAPSSLY